MQLIIGQKYLFEIQKVNREGKYSIITYDNNSFYCPKVFSDNAESIELRVLNIIDEKVYFDLDIFNYLDQETFIADLISINNENPNYGLLFFDIKSFPFQLKCPKWMLHERMSLPKKIPLKIQEYRNNKSIFFDFEEIKHYKFEKDNVYEFKILKKIENKDTIVILDEEDDIQYFGKTSFASTKTEDVSKFRFLGLNRRLNALLIQDENSLFLEPSTLLSNEEFEFLNQEHLVNNSIKEEYINQLEKEDNFWVITVSRYLPLVIESYIKRNRVEEAYLGVKIFNKVNGFIKAKNLLAKIPKKASSKLKHGLSFNERKVESLVDYLNYTKVYEVKDLFKSKIQFEIGHQLNVFNTFLYFELSENYHDYIEIILKNFNSNEQGQKDSVLQKKLNELSYKHLIVPFTNEIKERYFFNREDFEKWFVNGNYVEHLNMYLNSQPKYFEPNKMLGKIFIKALYKGLNTGKDFASYFLKSIYDNSSLIEPQKKAHLEKQSLKIFDKIIIIDSKNAFYIEKGLFVFINGSSNHIINFSTHENGFSKFRVLNNFRNKFLSVSYHAEDNFLLENNNSIRFEKGIIKQRLDSSRAFFISIGLDENLRTIDGIIYPPTKEFFNSKRYFSGQELYVKTSFYDDGRFVANEINLDKYFFDDYGKSFDCNVSHKFSIGEKCPVCNSDDIEVIKIECHCNNCNQITLEGIEIMLIESQKTLFLTKYSIDGIYGKDFIDKLKEGDNINLQFNGPFKYHLESTDRIIHSHKVEYIDSSKFLQRADKTFFELNKLSLINRMFVLLELERLYETDTQEKISLREINIRLAGLLKSPKSYLYRFIEDYNKIIESIRGSNNIEDKVNEMLNKVDNEYEKTLLIFPKLKTLNDSLYSLKFLNSKDFSAQLELLEEASDSNKTLIKLILINNLIEGESENQDFSANLKKQIIEILQKKRTDITFGVSRKSIEEKTENEILLNDIKKGVSSEGQNLEFKETLMTPVLDNKQRELISRLNKKKVDGQLSSKEEKIYLGILGDLKTKRGDKECIKNIVFSAIKNICAFLNSNDGKLIIGVRDDNTLVGLDEEYSVSNLDFDTLQQSFENNWKKLVVEHSVFRPFIEIKKVVFEEKEFCVFEINYPYDIKEPCFIKKSQNEEVVYVKNSSTTMPLKGKQIREWKRKSISKLSEVNYVYLMKDKFNCTKIGHSNNPEKRRGTLMSQDNKIELLYKFPFPNKEIALRVEKHFQNQHEKYITETGGEWYNLDDFHVQEIVEGLQKQSEFFKVK